MSGWIDEWWVGEWVGGGGVFTKTKRIKNKTLN